ncbi:hypothetical protein LSUCC0031_10185 [Rhodobacterales bacterium LSUCC0031]|nr:hypothetical protein [Rhodobacterales bacterium LSUCC0031]
MSQRRGPFTPDPSGHACACRVDDHTDDRITAPTTLTQLKGGHAPNADTD